MSPSDARQGSNLAVTDLNQTLETKDGRNAQDVTKNHFSAVDMEKRRATESVS